MKKENNCNHNCDGNCNHECDGCCNKNHCSISYHCGEENPKTFRDMLSIGFMLGYTKLGDIIDANLWLDKRYWTEQEALRFQRQAIEDMANSRYSKVCLTHNETGYTINENKNMAIRFPFLWVQAQVRYFLSPE